MGMAQNNVTNTVQESETNIIYSNVRINHLHRYREHTHRNGLMSSEYKNIMINLYTLLLKLHDYIECPPECRIY